MTIGPIYDISQILEDPHVIEREIIADYPDADMGAFPMHHVVPRLSGHAGRDPQPGAEARAAQPRAAGRARRRRRKIRRAGERRVVVEGAAEARSEDE